MRLTGRADGTMEGIARTTFIVGPAGSGKTEALLQRAAQRYRADPFAAEGTGDPQLAAVAAIYGAYRAALHAHRWLAPTALPSATAEVGDAPALPSLVIADGFRFFHGGELRLLAALGRDRDLLLAFDPGAGERAAHSYQRLRRLFPDAAEESIDSRAPVSIRPPAKHTSGAVASSQPSAARALSPWTPPTLSAPAAKSEPRAHSRRTVSGCRAPSTVSVAEIAAGPVPVQVCATLEVDRPATSRPSGQPFGARES